MAAMVMPAAIDNTSVSSRTASAQLVSAPTTSLGLTATTTTSDSAAAQAGLGTTRVPGNRASITCRRSASTSAITIDSGSQPASTSPIASASPIRPPPRSANCMEEG